ncbi:uncharacterized protein [Physcomitrium patens]|uniref:Secreted protein n=1 Tax=Physcomitrium patens TaxID=3218 RepID=A0A2K1IAP4_PHYPA|nr:hypothetical protein PHYPA_030924 [Physcomitrium patens]
MCFSYKCLATRKCHIFVTFLLFLFLFFNVEGACTAWCCAAGRTTRLVGDVGKRTGFSAVLLCCCVVAASGCLKTVTLLIVRCGPAGRAAVELSSSAVGVMHSMLPKID